MSNRVWIALGAAVVALAGASAAPSPGTSSQAAQHQAHPAASQGKAASPRHHCPMASDAASPCGAGQHAGHACGASGPAGCPMAAQHAATPQCPVMKAPVRSIGENTPKSVFRGKTYYFCCPGCKPQFDKDPTRYVCVVSGAVLPKKPAAKATYKGKTYYFCCPGCKPQFEKNPAKYVASR